jgi:hypothetical protein
MAENSSPFRFAGRLVEGGPLSPLSVTAATLFGPLGPLGQAAAAYGTSALIDAFTPDKESPYRVGDVLSYLNKQPYKVYAGPDYGAQSVASYRALQAKDPKSFPAIKGELLAPAKAESTTQASQTAGRGPVDWGPKTGSVEDQSGTTGTVGDVSAGKVGEQLGTAGEEPGFNTLLEKFGKFIDDPEFRRTLSDERIREFAATQAVTQALGAQKSEERRRREVELEKIKQWTSLATASMNTNLLSQAMLGQAVIAAQQPSASMAEVLSKGTQAAAQVLGSPSLRVS